MNNKFNKRHKIKNKLNRNKFNSSSKSKPNKKLNSSQLQKRRKSGKNNQILMKSVKNKKYKKKILKIYSSIKPKTKCCMDSKNTILNCF